MAMAHAQLATETHAETAANPLPDTLCATCARRSGEDGLLLGNRASSTPLLAFCARCAVLVKGAIAAWEAGR